MSVQDDTWVWENRSRIRFRSAGSSAIQHGLPEVVFRLPDPVQKLGEAAIERRALIDGDFAILDGTRYFVRATLTVPVSGYSDRFRWAVWVEADWRSYKAYWESYADEEPSALEPFRARLVTAIDGFHRSSGLIVRVRPSTNGDRPALTVINRNHPLGRAQRDGISPQQAVAHARTVGVLLMVA